MISFDALAGNNALKNSLKHALNERFPQTVLLSGDDPAALKTLATVLAAGILCEGTGSHPCGNCLPCRKVEQGVHPDLLIVDDGERRVTVIHHAQNLNPMAQNALLKELEEPPAYAFFILTAEQPDSLLQTVRSRCTKFALEPSQAAVSDEEAASLLAPYLSAVAERREDRMMLSAMGLEKTPRRALSGVLGILQAAVRDAIFVSKALPQKPLQPALRKQTQALAGAVSMERLLAVYDFIDVLIDRVSRNAASAAVTCALTSDIYRICYAS